MEILLLEIYHILSSLGYVSQYRDSLLMYSQAKYFLGSTTKDHIT